MQQQTEMEARAQRLGYPLGVGGYAPFELGYWVEPSFGWVGGLAGADNPRDAATLARLTALPTCWNENMAPRFPDGTWLAGHRLRVGSAVAVGAVLCFWRPGAAKDCPEWARVVAVEWDCLRLACDNGQRAYRLPWLPEEARRVGRVYVATHYIRQPYLGR